MSYPGVRVVKNDGKGRTELGIDLPVVAREIIGCGCEGCCERTGKLINALVDAMSGGSATYSHIPGSMPGEN